MLLKAQDSATFRSSITQKEIEVWARYSVEGRVNGEPVKQGDERMFAVRAGGSKLVHRRS
jgi:hypothetical protein